LNLLFACLAFFGHGEFGLLHSITCVWFMIFSPNSCKCQSLHHTFTKICTKFDSHCCSFFGSITKSHQARYMTPNIRT
jgi:hypothetical protein